MSTLARRNRDGVNIWPGFVDALASLLLVFIFMLLMFVLAQFFLTDTLAGRNQALAQLSQGINELFDDLSMERSKSAELERTIDELSERLQATLGERDSLAQELTSATEHATAMATEAEALQSRLDQSLETVSTDREQIELQLRQIASLEADLKALRVLRSRLEDQVGSLGAQLKERDQALTTARDRTQALEARLADAQERTRLAQRQIDARDVRLQDLGARSEAKVTSLNNQIAALREQISRLSITLGQSEAKVKEQKLQIGELGRRLNLALAHKVEELSRYRSEFFGRLRQVLGNRPEVRIVGDRFLLQSELLFDTASAELGPEGERQLVQLASTLKEIARDIPADLDWVLRIDGHTDRRPIHTERYPSNWELSTARAVSIVDFLIKQGIPPERLAAAGFGEFRPLNPANTEAAYRQNRRIEIKLTRP
jgi:chemotaxis protein MotB